MLIAEQGPLRTSYGSWLADEIQRRFFDWLDQPVQRVSPANLDLIDAFRGRPVSRPRKWVPERESHSITTGS
ncbi:hypothetical protein ACH347_19325 [Saccharopolyspora sp. 5N102]|uniref:hypothetical protein n=1 Tax=Saccharopolyspora sp. 5N102 TaxID=3375155 RepID=UPI0037AC741D